MKIASLLLVSALFLPISMSYAQTTLSVTDSTSRGVSGNRADAAIDAGAGGTRNERGVSASSTVTAQDADAARAIGIEAKAERSNASTSEARNGTTTSSMHRSAVASFVQSLRGVADRDGGIGAQVRAVAQSQNESASTTAEAIQKVESRSRFMSLLFGTDWKNIGTIRSQIAKTEADAVRLQTALSQATDVSVKADLEAHIAALESEKAKIQTFVDMHAGSFSLLGWFTKLL